MKEKFFNINFFQGEYDKELDFLQMDTLVKALPAR